MFLTDISNLSTNSKKIVPINCSVNISAKCKKNIILDIEILY